VKSTHAAGSKGYDQGKKASCIKRHMAVGTQGLPRAIAVTTAQVMDRKEALQALRRCKPGLAQALACCVTVATWANLLRRRSRASWDGLWVHMGQRIERHTFKVKPKRWGVERSVASLENSRWEVVRFFV